MSQKYPLKRPLSRLNWVGCIGGAAIAGYVNPLVRVAEGVWALGDRSDVAKYTTYIYYPIKKHTRLTYATASGGSHVLIVELCSLPILSPRRETRSAVVKRGGRGSASLCLSARVSSRDISEP